MLELNQEQHQELVLMCGSKKDWQIYLGLDDRTASRLWLKLKLLPPTKWLRSQSRVNQLELLAEKGSYLGLANHLGMSATAARNIINPAKIPDPSIDPKPLTEGEWTYMFEKFKSVKFVARLAKMTEAQVRKALESYDLDVSELIDYSIGGNANAKGRRAELDFAKDRGNKIREDMNVTHGSQAKYDFLDEELGRVNVKSSRCWRYKAKTRRGNPEYWKISTRGRDQADVFVIMLYDSKMENRVFSLTVPVEELPGTFSVRIQLTEGKWVIG